MGQFWETIPEFLVAWIQKQEMFWVATAPSGAEGHVNVSPKGVKDSFHIVDERTVWYEDMTGSGVETISHVRENGRITILFSAFEGPPRIARLFGTGEVFEFGTPEYDMYVPPEKRRPGLRSVILIHVHKVGSSCGFAVPFYKFERHRVQLMQYAEKLEQKDREGGLKGGDESLERDAEGSKRVKGGLKAYWAAQNVKSIDGLPGLAAAFDSEKVPLIAPEVEELKTSDSPAYANGTAVKSDNKHGSNSRFTDEAKLVLVFSLGVAVAAVYFKTLGAAV